MTPEIVQVVFWLLIATVVLLAYEMHESLKPHYCEHCAHCAALRELEQERDSAVRRAFNDRQELNRRENKSSITWQDRDDDPRDKP